ncbi:RNA-binding protein [Helicobacter pylori]|uniref:RNA-binding protein n=1 Tax=Helicobacter pylori TaxID=210 RepID=UPI00165A9F5D|nr:RNA-binding protein [Helicobacter pylori]
MRNIYVGNLVYSATSEQVKELFSQFGKVFNVKLIYDRETKKPKGFGFVEMQEEGVKEAIAKLDNTDFMGRTIRVTEANPKKS